MVANNLVNSTILYGAALWGTTTQSNFEKLQKSQIKAAKMVLNQKWEGKKIQHRQETLDKLKWPNVTQISELAILNLVKKAILGRASFRLNRMFKVIYPRHPRGLITITIQHKGPLKRKSCNFSAKAAESFNVIIGSCENLTMPT